MFGLTPEFKQSIINTHGDAGRTWLEQLPQIIDYAKDTWQLTNLQIMPVISYNYVAASFSQIYQQAVVLKISLPNQEYHQEQQALIYFDGHGINRLLDFNREHGILLLQKIGSGVNLKSLLPHDENQAILHAATVIKQLHAKPMPIETSTSYPSLANWLSVLDDFQHPAVDQLLVTIAQTLATQLLDDKVDNYLLHGDLHHENILQNHDGSWLAIDPKGVIGELAYEVGAFMRNPVPELLSAPNLSEILSNRIDQFGHTLNLDKSRLNAYSYVTTMLAIIWNIEDNGNQWPAWLVILNTLKNILVERNTL